MTIEYILSKEKVILAQIESLLVFRYNQESEQEFKKRVQGVFNQLQNNLPTREEVNGL